MFQPGKIKPAPPSRRPFDLRYHCNCILKDPTDAGSVLRINTDSSNPRDAHRAARTCLTLMVSRLHSLSSSFMRDPSLYPNAGLKELCNQNRQSLIPTCPCQQKKNIHPSKRSEKGFQRDPAGRERAAARPAKSGMTWEEPQRSREENPRVRRDGSSSMQTEFRFSCDQITT